MGDSWDTNSSAPPAQSNSDFGGINMMKSKGRGFSKPSAMQNPGGLSSGMANMSVSANDDSGWGEESAPPTNSSWTPRPSNENGERGQGGFSNDRGGRRGGFRGNDGGGGFRSGGDNERRGGGFRDNDGGDRGGGGFRSGGDNERRGGGFRGNDGGDRGGGGFRSGGGDDNERRGGGFRGGRGGFRGRGEESGGGYGNSGGGGYGGNDSGEGKPFSWKPKSDDAEDGGGSGGGWPRRNGNDDGGSGGWQPKSNGYDDGDGGRGGFSDRGRGGGRGRGGRGGGPPRSEGGGGFGSADGEEGQQADGEGEAKPARQTYVPAERSDDDLYKDHITSGINFDAYDQIQVNVTGANAPLPITSFAEAKLRKLIMENIEKCGYKKPTPIQKYAIPIVLAGRDVMASAQTGSGKTAAFLFPIIHNLLETQVVPNAGDTVSPYALVIAPTRELAIQICDDGRKFVRGSCIKCVVIYGGTEVRSQLVRVEQGCHILVATPGRLKHFIERGKVRLDCIRYLVLDEADRMLDMGFLEDIKTVVNNSQMTQKGERRTLMFSATFPEEIQRLAANFLDNYIFIGVGIVGGASKDVKQNIVEVGSKDKRQKLMNIIREAVARDEKIIVFAEQKRTADFLATYLSESDISTTSVHGDRLQSQREEAIYDIKSGRRKVLVATSVCSRGLDIRGIDLVINYDLPKEIDDYVHRIGRTGRVGNIGKSISFFDPDHDGNLARPLVRILNDAGQDVPSFLVDASQGTGFGGGGGGSFGTSRDIRSFNQEPTTASALDEDESWD